MKWISIMLFTCFVFLGFSMVDRATLAGKTASPGEDYVLIGWNDLGMHCINPSYADLGMLPPFNNLWVQVIQRGNPPRIVTSGISVEYAIANNRTVEGKTDFWTCAASLFADLIGVANPPNGIGLTGQGLSGQMQLVGDHFEATGIPALPYDDQLDWNPFQTAVVTLKADSGKGKKAVKKIKVVLPVSDEINCSQCHMQGMDGTVNLPADAASGLTGTDNVYLNILMVHDFYNGPNASSPTTEQNLVDMRPVLCARCHSSNALGAPGTPGTKSVSLAMHGWHNPDRAPDATCYSCHPGELTQCLRTAINGMGYLGTEPSCQSGQCHGGMSAMGDPSRNPWVSLPNCEQCHGVNYTTGTELYRHAKGHGGIYCEACHNSPHAWWPSKLWVDNLEPRKIQGTSYAIGRDCSVCHTKKQEGDSPHVTYYPRYPR